MINRILSPLGEGHYLTHQSLGQRYFMMVRCLLYVIEVEGLNPATLVINKWVPGVPAGRRFLLPERLFSGEMKGSGEEDGAMFCNIWEDLCS